MSMIIVKTLLEGVWCWFFFVLKKSLSLSHDDLNISLLMLRLALNLFRRSSDSYIGRDDFWEKS